MYNCNPIMLNLRLLALWQIYNYLLDDIQKWLKNKSQSSQFEVLIAERILDRIFL